MSSKSTKDFILFEAMAGMAILIFGWVAALIIAVMGYDIQIKLIKRKDGVNERRDG